MQSSETILSAIPALSDKERLVVVLVQLPEGSRLELRQQSYGEGVGWFTQSTVQLEPGQVAQLKNSLGHATSGSPAARLPKSFNQLKSPAWQPRLVQADSA
ncbi:hypothetical protein ETAA8_63700 [Anatilimnocola aggregata]|uniref:Uncharacterized protein n=1 Tax=Anatilimnocola aggregata TaxID=2528021 RepID=A0A517YLW6_9BACT|nr:hypothetical protein [Anatilimnocola aggregata]QDU31217.1 hypothetical protein ETAA8_63700 [Anatilimnocola aggregata]